MFATVHYAPGRSISLGADDAFGGRICFWKRREKPRGKRANVIPGVGRMIIGKTENREATPGQEKASYINAAYMLAFGDRLFQQWRGIMSSKRISHTGHAFRLPRPCLGGTHYTLQDGELCKRDEHIWESTMANFPTRIDRGNLRAVTTY